MNFDVQMDNLFDITIEAHGRARDCELAGAFQLHRFSQKLDKKNISLYTDDRLAISKNSRPQSEKLKKAFPTIFRETDLNIVLKYNLKILNYLNVTLNLSKENYLIIYIQKRI